MFAPFRLKKTVGEAHTMDLGDSLNTKRALAHLGYLPTPEDGLDAYPDRSMLDALKSFQRDQGLAVDGIMKPDGRPSIV
jgi:peptidoglycan hydrolase-like protein with peptidoglycan-binding domain